VDATVRHKQRDLMLCSDCDTYRSGKNPVSKAKSVKQPSGQPAKKGSVRIASTASDDLPTDTTASTPTTSTADIRPGNDVNVTCCCHMFNSTERDQLLMA